MKEIDRKLDECAVKLNKTINEAHDTLVEFIKEHQKEKGYIDTQDPQCDAIHYLEWAEYDTNIYGLVKGIKVDDDGEILIAYEPESLSVNITYTDEDFKNEENWESLRYSEIEYVFTLNSILECISEYV